MSYLYRTLGFTGSSNITGIRDCYKIVGADGIETDILENLSKVNILVGPNNSGKSRFMRRIFASSSDCFEPAEIDLVEIETIVRGLVEFVKRHFSARNLAQEGALLWNPKPLMLVTGNTLSIDGFTDFCDTLERGALRVVGGGEITGSALSEVRGYILETVKRVKEKLFIATESVNSSFEINKVYIPTLRGLRHLHDKEDLYQASSRDEYFSQDKLGEKIHSIETGLGLFSSLQRMLLGSLENRRSVRKYEEFLQFNFFEGKPVTLIPVLGGKLAVKIGNEREQSIHHLGDGLQQLIIMTFSMFSSRERCTNIYIEEPELYLHPGMQRRLLELMTSDQFSNIQFYITTHSNHLLDMTLDYQRISVYNFRKDLDHEDGEEVVPKFTVTNVSNTDLNLLNELGVQNSSVFLVNCTIWVEGITDRLYLRHYMSLYKSYLESTSSDESEQGYPREDFEYAFVEYGGGNITHWSFLGDENSINVERLCARVVLVADADTDKKKLRHDTISARLGERFLLLPCREIENLISKDVLLRVVGSYGEVDMNSEFGFSDYKDRYLGTFIENHVLRGKSNRSWKGADATPGATANKGAYAASSGTIKDKISFAEKVIEQTKRFEDLSEAAKIFTEKLVGIVRTTSIG